MTMRKHDGRDEMDIARDWLIEQDELRDTREPMNRAYLFIFAFVMGMALSAILFTSFPEEQPCIMHSLLDVRQASGCIGDWVSGGLTCSFTDAQGNRIVTRGY